MNFKIFAELIELKAKTAILEIEKFPESRNREILMEVTQTLLQRNY